MRPAVGIQPTSVRPRTTTRPLAAVALLLLLLVPAARAGETTAGGGAKNVVVAFNNADGQLRAASGIAVSITAANSVATENLAFARSTTCRGCRTVAVAMQFVPIVSDADVIAPTNAAVAVNADCDSCATAAFAYQYVVTTGEPVRLSEAGRREVAAIRVEAEALAASELPFPELETELDRLAERFKAVVDAELTTAGQGVLREDAHVTTTEGDEA